MRTEIRTLARHFARDARGNMAIAMALVAVPLFGVAGAAMDYGGRLQAEARLQAAIDAGALAGAASEEGKEAAIKKTVRQYVMDNAAGKYLDGPGAVKVKISSDGVIRVSATAEYPTTILNIMGIKSLPIGALAETKRSESGAEIAMVLDVTGSMAGTKIDALKVAAKDFVAETTKPNANKPGAVRLSLVPYNKYVNVGMANRNASWMAVPADYSTTENICQDWTTNTNPHNCRNESYSYSSDGVNVSGTHEVCDYDTNTVNECRPVTSTYQWYGCAGSRDYPWNVRDGRPSLDIPGLLNVSCPNEITPLTSDVARLNTNIDALPSWGDTYIPAGLIWGWRTLSSEVPYTEGLSTVDAQAKGVTKHLVLMTDGENVTSKSSGAADHDGWDPDAGDATTAELCENIKNAGIVVHAIAFEVTDASTKSMLQACATGGNYYDASDPARLSQAFDAIAGKINQVALSK
ncbi:MAG: pilus assembly protein [Anderseniella sp.]|jgi:Flp pilus assembly protein TadG|nr:pilus assembly protein [Anderseniella sp.]